ncbi:MAG: radical SAM protein [Promethearchaeota archaeon]|nr:MAG: radical SAM protein [Candidatus Lokiarchaeota archaeon]
MKILYINPGRIRAGLDYVIQGQPLNLLTLAGMVPEHEASLIDYKVQDYNEKALKSELNRHDIVALTSMTPQIYSALNIAEIAKNQGCKTIIGGYHPTLSPDFSAQKDYVDFIVRGEGEHTFKELITFLDGNPTGISKKEIKGISYKNANGRIIHTEDRPLEPNLDNFPIPNRDLIDYKDYLYLGARLGTLESSRGCPYSCKFCCIHKMWQDPKLSYRTKSVKRIMQEIYDINWKNDFIFFCEDNFTINVRRTKKILDTIIKAGIPNKMLFSCQSRIDTLDRNPWLIDLMHKAGMRQVFLGIESVHQQSLNAMNKQNTTPKMTREVVNALQDRGISIFGGVIIGYPGETKKMVRQTIQFTKSLDLTCVQFTPITAFPGTQFYDEMKAEGKVVTDNYRRYNLFQTMMNTDELSAMEMYELVMEAYASYYLSGRWLKMVIKRYLNPFGKFNWMSYMIPNFIKQAMKGGLNMLRSQGISQSRVSEELKKMIEKSERFKVKTGEKFKIEEQIIPSIAEKISN